VEGPRIGSPLFCTSLGRHARTQPPNCGQTAMEGATKTDFEETNADAPRLVLDKYHVVDVRKGTV